MSAVLEKINDLPEGWKWIPLGEYVENHDKARIPVSTKERVKRKGDFPYYGASGVIDSIDSYTHEGEFVLIGEDGANLLTRSKPISFIAKGQFWVNNHAHVLKCKDGLPNAYFCYYINSIPLNQYVTGTAQPKLNQNNLNKIPIPVAPPEQQKRIVAKIEELFSHIDAGIEALKKAKQLLKQYRQSVLKAAVIGELTKEWREANKDKLMSAESLKIELLKLKALHNKEVIKRWEIAKERWVTEGEIGKRPGKPKINDTLEVVDEELKKELPSIPKEWCWVMLGDIADAIDPQPSHRTPPVVDGGIPYIGIGDVDKKNDFINFEDARKVSQDVLVEHKIRYDLKVGDYIIGKIGTIGKPFHIPVDRFFTLSANVVLVSPVDELINPNYLFNLCKSPVIEYQFDTGSKATTQAAFGIKKVRLLTVPYSTLAEQKEIVKKMEVCLEKATRLDVELDVQLKKSEKNKQSILASAFKGII